MPEINEGLEINGEPVVSFEEGDVNTQSGFEAGLSRAVTGETAQPEEGEEGAPEAPAPEEGQPEEGQPEEAPGADDDLQNRLNWALGVIDRQGNELGDLRARVQEMQVPQQQTTPDPIVNVEALLDQHGGEASINWAIDNAPHLIEDIARSWAISGDPEGAVFYADYRAEQSKLEYGGGAPQFVEPDPTVTQISTERKLVEVFREARETDPGFAEYEPGISAALSSEETPDEIKMMLMSGNVEHMRSGMNFLKPYARIETYKLSQTSEAEPSAEATAKEEQRRDTARRTAIVSGSQRLQDAGSTPETGDLTSEERIKRFKDAFEEEPSTSIAAGLTINGQPVLPARPKRS